MHTVRMLGDGDGASPSPEGASRPAAAADLRTSLTTQFALLEATLVVSSELGLSHQELDLLLTLASAPARRGADLSCLVAADGELPAAPLRRLSERGLVRVRQRGLLRRGSRARLSDDGDRAVRAALRGLAREFREARPHWIAHRWRAERETVRDRSSALGSATKGDIGVD